MPPLNLYARVRISLCILHTRPRVQRAPGIPCALPFRGRALSRLGRIAPRDCGVMSSMKHNAFMKTAREEGHRSALFVQGSAAGRTSSA